MTQPDEIEEHVHFVSPLFGATRHATKDEMDRIDILITACPVAVFRAMNQLLKQRGLIATIDVAPSATTH